MQYRPLTRLWRASLYKLSIRQLARQKLPSRTRQDIAEWQPIMQIPLRAPICPINGELLLKKLRPPSGLGALAAAGMGSSIQFVRGLDSWRSVQFSCSYFNERGLTKRKHEVQNIYNSYNVKVGISRLTLILRNNENSSMSLL